jgi:MoxR-like ATPase
MKPIDHFNIFNNIEKKGKIPPFELHKNIEDPKHYIPSKALINAINVAMFLGQPLLVTGEPGTGKTQLAYAITNFFELGEPFVFNTKTTSTAKDLFYTYDALAHFQYVQSNNRQLNVEEIETLFIKYQALGKAIKSNERHIVLIDEIDKAPRDLPNDILNVIEKLEFEVPEINKVGRDTIKADPENRPIVIITSNSEKNLPDPFLRRCVFFHIDFPNNDQLREILKKRILGEKFNDDQWDSIILYFNMIRNKLKHKKPATSELIYWVTLLLRIGFDFNKLGKGQDLSPQDRENLLISFSILAKDLEDIRILKDLLA